MLARRLGLSLEDLRYLGLGAVGVAFAALLAVRVGGVLSLGLLVALALLFGIVAAFMAAPHVATAATIPLFALLPTAKVVVAPWVGPLKDLVILGAIGAAATLVVQRSSSGERQQGDHTVAVLVASLLALYAVNVGGALERDAGWLHGTRLVSGPLLLLLVGLTLSNPRRTLRWATSSLVATATVVAAFGILQQAIGPARLVSFGYSYDQHVRTIEGHLRSFGTLDEPFAYAAFLMFGLAAVLMWMRRGPLAVSAGTVIATGLVFSYVRSALIIGIALLAVWLARRRQTTVSFFLVGFAVMVAAFLLVRSSEASESRTVRTGPNFFLTVNGRTEAWRVVLDRPGALPFGRGVGEVGTAADRATYQVSRTAEEARQAESNAVVDSGYFATLADVGLIGIAVLLGLFGRLLLLARKAERRGSVPGALALGLLTIMVLDPLARESLTGFPTAFVGFLMIGLALAAAAEEEEGKPAARAAKGPSPEPEYDAPKVVERFVEQRRQAAGPHVQANELAELRRQRGSLARRADELAERELAERAEQVKRREQELARRYAELQRSRAQPAPPIATSESATYDPAALRLESGVWNLNALERLVESRGGEFPQRVDGWRTYLLYLREFASADGGLTPSLDGLVAEEFAELIEASTGRRP